jgi:hypothetical protein
LETVAGSAGAAGVAPPCPTWSVNSNDISKASLYPLAHCTDTGVQEQPYPRRTKRISTPKSLTFRSFR